MDAIVKVKMSCVRDIRNKIFTNIYYNCCKQSIDQSLIVFIGKTSKSPVILKDVFFDIKLNKGGTNAYAK